MGPSLAPTHTHTKERHHMSEKNVWFITGAGRGLGAVIAKAALAAGYAVVATARTGESVTKALGAHDDLLAVDLDVTDPTAAQAAVAATVERFGRLDVLVNNAGSFQAGFFEEMTPEAFRSQIDTTLFGPVNVTRAALPQLRLQRSGLVMTISSTAGIASPVEFTSAYAASKFGVEGFMEALAPEVASFGIKTMLVEPGFFRTELLSPQSTQYAQPSIDDYAERTAATVRAWQGMDGKQAGDPAKLAAALIQLVALDEPPVRFAAGADAVAVFEQKAHNPWSRPTPTASCPPASRTTPEPADRSRRGRADVEGCHRKHARICRDPRGRADERTCEEGSERSARG
jgi:NAD(P)-dependent dehydrogenase (short-subunit alcohol dehydrogenase family)